ncbi:MAG: AraC family transcriptional regulator [Rhodovulum sulfidophilum]|uniref:AraC family transcriptional regulator n=1 Tax=Rhodovulum sulfidophilum TaxID=35806 RepID=A0A2W5PQM7_RHOSU|nr:MAG: AraC family transcriptional regulator [Rhodovulum sulfidophilum]
MNIARVSADAFPVAEQRRAWLAALDQLALSAETPGTAAPVPGWIAARATASGARIAMLVGGPQVLRPRALPAPTAPVLIALVLRGRARLVADGRRTECAANDILALDAGADWRLEARTDIELVALALPRGPLLSRLGRNSGGLGAGVLGATVAALAAKPLLRTVAQNFAEADPADLAAIEMALTELVSSALLTETLAPDGGLTQTQAEHFRRVAAAIDARLTEPELSVGEIARREGFSVRYLQRLFARRGESFSDYLRRERLERCRADLADPKRARESVATIAQRWGFREQAHFTRAFGAAFGLTPTEARRPADPGAPGPAFRGRPTGPRRSKAARVPAAPPCPGATSAPRPAAPDRHHLPAHAGTVHWGYLSRALPPALRVEPGAIVTVETLTQHGGDDLARFVTGDPGAESVFAWTAAHKAIDRRGAGPMNAAIFGRGAGEGFGVHICTGPIHVRGAEPGDVLEVEILDLAPRPCANPAFAGKAFASNVSAWWGYQYDDLLGPGDKRETVTIYEIDLADPSHARALHSYRWTPQTDPFGVRHATIDYPGIPVDPNSVERRDGVLTGVTVPARPHFGFVGVAPREAEIVDSIPPGYFGGNLDNWRIGKGARIFLPVAVEGALLSVGDGHFAQGDGEINGTGLECSLTGTLRLALHKAGQLPAHLRGLPAPLLETGEHWIVQAFSFQNHLRDLGRDAQSEVYARSNVDLALRNAFRQTRRFLMEAFDLAEDEALSLMSVGVDFGVTQVADGNFGVHATIAKALFAGRAPQPRSAAAGDWR